MFHWAKTHWLYTQKESGYGFSWKTGKIQHHQIKPAALAILRVELKLFSKSHLSYCWQSYYFRYKTSSVAHI